MVDGSLYLRYELLELSLFNETKIICQSLLNNLHCDFDATHSENKLKNLNDLSHQIISFLKNNFETDGYFLNDALTLMVYWKMLYIEMKFVQAQETQNLDTLEQLFSSYVNQRIALSI